MNNKLVVTVSNFDRILARAELADSTKAQYGKAVRNAIDAGIDLTNVDQVADYAVTLKKSSKSFLKAALRLWLEGIEISAKGSATPENVAAVQATVYRIEALNDAIKVKKSNGTKKHIWLSRSEVIALSDYCDGETVICKRDQVVLGLLVSAGLRRDELVNLTFSDIITKPENGGLRTHVLISGKGGVLRDVPINNRLAQRLAEWSKLCEEQGVGLDRIARSVNQRGAIGKTLTSSAMFKIVRKAGEAIGRPTLAPHDLRRTFAQLAHDAGVPIGRISKLLGHKSVNTTMTYLDLSSDDGETASDFIPF